MYANSKKITARRVLAFFGALIMALSSLPLSAFATDESGVRPEDGVNYGSPFVSGNPSQNYRIPNLVTMDDGTLVAQADARWDDYSDGGGNDSIVAYSDDNGEEWHYSMLTYYPDNGNVHDKSSTSVCDSALATDGKMLYTLTTFFPAGYALNPSSADNMLTLLGGDAFNDDGTLRLKRSGDLLSYNYYLGEFDKDGKEGRAPIYDTSGEPVSGWLVDHDFYVYNNGVKSGNLFYDDCEFQTAKTNFLLFRSSSDGGKTWSDFKLVDIKNTSEAFYGVGPGRGVVTEDGTIIFGCYKWTNSNSSQSSSFIYSDDGGDTWSRIESLPSLKDSPEWTSECQVVELDDGTIRLFCRSGKDCMVYADAKRDENGSYYWVNSTGDNGGPMHFDYQLNGQNYNITANNQYSVIKYSKKVLWNGNYCTLLIASHANGGGESRTDGHLTFMLLNDANEIVNASQYQYTSGDFGYSCLTELADGRIASLYEYADDGSSFAFKTFDVEETSGFYIPDNSKEYNTSLVVGDSKVFYVNDEAENYDDSVVSAQFAPNYTATANNASDATYTGAELMLTDALYTFTRRSENEWFLQSSDLYLNIGDVPSNRDLKAIAVNYVDGGYFQFINEDGKALYFNDQYQFTSTTEYREGSSDYDNTLFEIYAPVDSYDQSSESDPVPGYERVNNISDIQDGASYLIGCEVDGDYYFVFPSRDSVNIYSHGVKANNDYVQNGFKMTVTALAVGSATLVCGNDTYNFEVDDGVREIVGVVDYDPVIYTHGSGDDITALGTDIADGTVDGEKVTQYSLNDDSYEIVSVTPCDGFDYNVVLPNSSITAADGKLTGTLNLANGTSFKSIEQGTYVTLKTTLRDSSGLTWTQYDRLYVASNPVPGHVIIGNYNRVGTSVIGYGITLGTYVMAMDSYGNTDMTSAQVAPGVVGNANILFPTSSNYSTYNNTLEEIATTANDNNSVKYAGAAQYYAGTAIFGNLSYQLNFLENANADTVDVAYYYYDKSSNKNQGITADSSDPADFSITMGRMPVNSQYEVNNQWQKNVTINSSSATKLSGYGSVENNTALFGTGEYTILDSNHRKNGTINLSTRDSSGVDTVQPNTTRNLKGAVQYQETATLNNSRATSINNINLTFEIKMCDKSNERNTYNESVSSIKKSTWYTNDSWREYVDTLLVYQEYLNDYTVLTTDSTRENDPDSDVKKSYYSYLYDDNGDSKLDLVSDQLKKIADFDRYNNAKEYLLYTLADEKFSAKDLEALNSSIDDMKYFYLTDEDKQSVLDTEQESVDAETEQILSLANSLTEVEYDDISAAQAAVELANSNRDPDVYDLSTLNFSYTTEVNVGGTAVVGYIYPTQSELDDAIENFLSNIKKMEYKVYLDGKELGTAQYGSSVIVSSDSYMKTDVNDVDSPDYDGKEFLAWSYSYAAPSRDYEPTAPKYMISAKSVGFVVKGDTYLTTQKAVSDEKGYTVKFVTDDGKIFDIQYTDNNTVTVPNAPDYAFYTFSGYEGGYSEGEDIKVYEDTVIVAKYTADTSNSYNIVTYNSLTDWEQNTPTTDSSYKYNELVELEADNAYCWVSGVYNSDYDNSSFTIISYGNSYSFYACRSYADGEGLIALTEDEYKSILQNGKVGDKIYQIYDGNGNLIEASKDENGSVIYPEISSVTVLENTVPIYDENGDLSKFSMIGMFVLPDSCNIVECGILFSSDLTADLKIENVGLEDAENPIARMKASSYTCGNQFVINVKAPSDGRDVNFKYCGYAIVEDQNGNLKTVYSKSVMGTTANY